VSAVALLPEQFAELEPYAEKWALATEGERWDTRLSSSMDELIAYYNAIFPHVEEAMAFCDKFPLKEMPEDAQNLLRMVYSFVIVSFPVELWGQPWVPDTRGASLNRISEPVP
jgi:hypothetical protein